MTKKVANSRQGYVAAMVLSTALSALGTCSGTASAATERAVSDISRYCTVCWRNARLSPECWTDCTQEVFCRLLERVAPEAWTRILKVEGDERREFLRAIDAVKKRTLRQRKPVMFAEDGFVDDGDVESRRRADERDAVEQAASAVLTPRQQRIVQLSFEGWSPAAIARKLHVPVERVSDEKYKAIRKLREHLLPAEDAA